MIDFFKVFAARLCIYIIPFSEAILGKSLRSFSSRSTAFVFIVSIVSNVCPSRSVLIFLYKKNKKGHGPANREDVIQQEFVHRLESNGSIWRYEMARCHDTKTTDHAQQQLPVWTFLSRFFSRNSTVVCPIERRKKPVIN